MNRRDILKLSAAGVAAAALAPRAPARLGAKPWKVGVIGCGGRGTGAAANALEASPDAVVTALADVFSERVESARKHLTDPQNAWAGRVQVDPARCFTGFDAYRALLATDVDVVLLATPPHFRPMHLAAAVAAGKHAFVEKPVAVDAPGVRSVLASAETARQKQLSIVAGTQRRHERSYLEAMARVRSGAIGRIVSARCYWNQGGLWMHPRKPEWNDMEWQLRNWLYFTWLSGDHIVEQHVHNLDVLNWAIGAHPQRALGFGGRQVRTSPAYGHVFDHFAIEYEYPGGISALSMCRQIDGCAGRVEEVIVGTEGVCTTSSGRARIEGAHPWKFDGDAGNPYVQEHVDLFGAIASGTPLNEAAQIAESTLTAIQGRMSAYTGQAVTWEQALASKLDLAPPSYAFGELSMPAVAVPGSTPLI